MSKVEIIEINGMKFEVDLTTAKKIEEFRVGDTIKVLIKEYSSYDIYPGIIIGFEFFKERPTICIAYLKMGYNTAEIKFIYYNKDSKDIEITHTQNFELIVKPDDVYTKIDNEILSKKKEIEDLERKREFFTRNFDRYFDEIVSVL